MLAFCAPQRRTAPATRLFNVGMRGPTIDVFYALLAASQAADFGVKRRPIPRNSGRSENTRP